MDGSEILKWGTQITSWYSDKVEISLFSVIPYTHLHKRNLFSFQAEIN